MLRRGSLLVVALAIALAAAAGCGFNVAPADLFTMTRTGGSGAVTVVVSDGGTVRCNAGPSRTVPDPLLLAARDLAVDLDKDAKAHLHLAAHAGSVYRYSASLPDGTVTFADNSGGHHPELGRAQLLAAQLASGPCTGG